MLGLLLVANAGAFACGPSGDEHPPMMGDCPTCMSNPPPAGGATAQDAGALGADADAGTLDAQTFPPPDGVDMIDVGLLAPEASDAIDMLPDALNFAH